MTTITTSEELANLKNGDWILLVKNSLFWKAKVELEQLQPDGEERFLLQIGYGKNKALSLHSDPSQALPYPTREKAIANLAKLFKDKIKNGYESSSFELCELQAGKEARPSTQKKAKEPEIENKPVVNPEANSHIEHKCQQIPTVLTFNFGDSDGEAGRREEGDSWTGGGREEAEEEEEDFTLGKRNLDEHQKASNLAGEEAESQAKAKSENLMSIRDMLDQKKAAQHDLKCAQQNLKRPSDSFLSNTPKREPDAKKSSKENSLAKVAATSHSRNAPNSQSKDSAGPRQFGISLQNSSHKQPAVLETEEQVSKSNRKWSPFPTQEQMSQVAQAHAQAMEEEPAEAVNWFFKRRIHGTNLYEVSQHGKTFTESLTIQTKEQYLYLEYEVNEDMTLNRKELHQFSNAVQPVRAAAEIAQRVRENGYVKEAEELSAGLGYGTISSLKSRSQHFRDHTKQAGTLPEALVDSHTPQPSAQKANPARLQPESERRSAEEEKAEEGSVEQPEESRPLAEVKESESAEEENEEQGENLQYECLSHSRSSLVQEPLEVQSSAPLIELYLDSLERRKLQREAWQGSTGQKRQNSMGIYPLGQGCEGMIPLMLLHNFKPSLDINSRPLSPRLDVVRKDRRGALLLVRLAALPAQRPKTQAARLLHRRLPEKRPRRRALHRQRQVQSAGRDPFEQARGRGGLAEDHLLRVRRAEPQDAVRPAVLGSLPLTRCWRTSSNRSTRPS